MTLTELWYPQKNQRLRWPVKILGWLLMPIAGLFYLLSRSRRALYRQGLLSTWRSPVPVIVVGNIAIGGTGKTPLTIALAQWLRERGHHPAIVSRGYGGTPSAQPTLVRSDTDPQQGGDEPVLMARRLNLPICVHPSRVAAVQKLLQTDATVDIVICDDGLQHYALARDIEIAVVDRARVHGNQRLIPAGPLRESVSRLDSVDIVVWNGEGDGEYYRGIANELVRLDGGERCPLQELATKHCHAIAGIGHPQRFFRQLTAAGLEIEAHVFPDHHRYLPAELSFEDDLPVLMTEKDAIKCEKLDLDLSRFWYLELHAELSHSLQQKLSEKVESLRG